jgi:hypothetical protein
MFRPTLCLALCLFHSTGIAASDDPSQSWQHTAQARGLSTAVAELETSGLDAESAFALGAVQMLRAVEEILQVRYQTYSGRLPLVPGMAASIPTNPDARFDPDFIEQAMTAALNQLRRAEQALETASAGEFGVVIDLDALWLDIDGDGSKSDFEALPFMFGALRGRNEAFTGEVRFDTADADWLKAYVHVLSALAEGVLAVDPTPAIRTVVEGRLAMQALGGLTPTFEQPAPLLEVAADTLLTLRGVPDAERTRSLHAHLKSAIHHNRQFWAKVETEQDDDREWLPNARQTSAFGVTVDAELAARWQEMLTDFESIVDGDTLLPFWRVRSEDSDMPLGINLKRVLTEPGDMDLVLWIQGSAAVSYLERGPLARGGAWREFQALTGRDALLFAFWLN